MAGKLASASKCQVSVRAQCPTHRPGISAFSIYGNVFRNIYPPMKLCEGGADSCSGGDLNTPCGPVWAWGTSTEQYRRSTARGTARRRPARVLAVRCCCRRASANVPSGRMCGTMTLAAVELQMRSERHHRGRARALFAAATQMSLPSIPRHGARGLSRAWPRGCVRHGSRRGWHVHRRVTSIVSAARRPRVTWAARPTRLAPSGHSRDSRT